MDPYSAGVLQRQRQDPTFQPSFFDLLVPQAAQSYGQELDRLQGRMPSETDLYQQTKLIQQQTASKEYLDQQHIRRLSEEERKQRSLEQEQKMVTEYMNNPANGVTLQERLQVNSQLARHFEAQSAPPAPLLASINKADETKAIKKAKAAELYASEFGLPVDSLIGALEQDEKTGGYTLPQHFMSYLTKKKTEELKAQSKPPIEQLPAAKRIAYERDSSFWKNRLEALQKSPPEVPEDGKQSPAYQEDLAAWNNQISQTRLELARVDKEAFGAPISPDQRPAPSIVTPTESTPAVGVGSLPLPAPAILSNTPSVKTAVQYATAPAPDGTPAKVVPSRDEYLELLRTGQIGPGSYILDNVGNQFEVVTSPNGGFTLKRVK